MYPTLTASALVSSLTFAAIPASAQGLAQTSSTATGAPEPKARATIESRSFQKEGRWHLRAGGSYLALEDFWISPGVSAELGYYPWESLGVDTSATLYFSTLTEGARELRGTQGLLPDAGQPLARLVVGPRWSFAYGKFLLEGTSSVLHFDMSLLLRLGVLVTDQNANFGGDIALAIQVGFEQRWLLWAEIGGWVGSDSGRRSGLSVGPAGTLGVGVQL